MATKGELLASAINVNDCLKLDPESTTLELDVVLDALSELPGEDGCDWVGACAPGSGAYFPATVASGGTPRRLGKHGVIRRDDTRLWALRMPSVMRIIGGSVVNLKHSIENGIVTNWDDTLRHLASFFLPATVGSLKVSGIMVGMESTTLQGFVRRSQVPRPCSKFFFLLHSSGHDAIGPSGPSSFVRRPQA